MQAVLACYVVLEMSMLVVPLAGKRSKKLSKELLIASVIIALFGDSKRVWRPKSCARLWIPLKVMLSAAMVIHCAAVVSKLILSLRLNAELLRQSLLCKLHRGLERHGPEVLNLKTQAGASDTQRSLVTTFAVEFKDVGRN